MVSWQLIQTIGIIFGPFLLPKAIAFYRSIRQGPAPSQIRPVPKPTSYALALLFLSALISLASTLPAFQSENIFRSTQSRLGTNSGVLFARLATLRPLTPRDEALRQIFHESGTDAKLTYLKFGPDALVSNLLVSSPSDASAEQSYLLHALPSLLFPHLLHAVVIGLATSGSILGATTQASKWRQISLIPAVILPMVEIYFLLDPGSGIKNRQSLRVADMQPLHWQLPIYRGIALASMDAVLGFLIWLASTGRAFVTPLTLGEKLIAHARRLEALMVNAKKISVLRNATVRDPDFRAQAEDYWRKENEIFARILEEPDVLRARTDALKRSESVSVGREVEAFVDSFVPVHPSSSSSSSGSIPKTHT